MYRIDSNAILLSHWFSKTTRTTPEHVIDICQNTLRRYDDAVRQMKKRSKR